MSMKRVGWQPRVLAVRFRLPCADGSHRRVLRSSRNLTNKSSVFSNLKLHLVLSFAVVEFCDCFWSSRSRFVWLWFRQSLGQSLRVSRTEIVVAFRGVP